MKSTSAKPFSNKLNSTLLLSILFLTPLFILPTSNNIIAHAKTLLVFIAALGACFSFILSTIRKKRWELILSPLTIPLVLFGIATAASTFFSSPYPVENLLGQGGVFISAIIIAVIGGSVFSKKHSTKLIDVLGVSAAVLSIASLMQMVGWGPSRLFNLAFGLNLPHDLLFNLAGSSLVALEVMLLAVVGLAAQIITNKKLSTKESILVPLILLGMGVNLWAILPGKVAAVTLPPLSASWTITLDSLRSPRSAIIGQGPEMYSSVYSQYRPLWTNGKSYWQFNFGSAANLPLTLIATMGLLGFATWMLLLIKVGKQLQLKENKQLPLTWVIATSFALMLLMPASTVIVLIQAIAIAAWIATKSKDFPRLRLEASAIQYLKGSTQELPRRKKTHSRWVLYTTTGIATICVFFASYLVGRAYTAYNYLNKANKAVAENDAIKVYENHRQAVTLNPYLDSIRRQYALTSLQISIAMSNNTEISTEERSQVVQLVSQSIREAQAATQLDPTDFQNWATLAEIYKNLIGSAEEADQWAVNALVKAVETNPTNPFFRVEMGSLFMNKEQYQDAASFFSQSIDLKPDLPIGYFQLGQALISLNQLGPAQNAWQQAIILLDPASEDYGSLTQEMEKLKAAIEATKSAQTAPAQQQQNQLTTPPGLTPPTEGQIQEPITPITEQNVEQAGSEIIKPNSEPIDLSDQSQDALN